MWPPISEASPIGSCSSSRTRISQERRPRQVERRNGLAPRHGWELTKEFVQRLAALQIVEQRTNRHAGAREHRRAAENARVAVHDFPQLRHALLQDWNVPRNMRDGTARVRESA